MPIRGSGRLRRPCRTCRASSRRPAPTTQPWPPSSTASTRAYEARFGFRYCVFVAGRPRAALLPEFRAALEADRDAEIQRGLDAVVDIARARYATLTG